MDNAPIFISYSSWSRGLVSELYRDLRLLLVQSWIDLVEQPPQVQIRENSKVAHIITSAIERCSSFIILVNERSLESSWVAFEVELATKKMEADPSFKVIPLLDEDTDINLVPKELRNLGVIDSAKGYLPPSPWF